MIKNKFGVGILLLAVLVSMALIPAVSAQKENDYSVTAEEAFKHANANMISFIAADAPNFESWTGASIDPKPVELYDINGQKLFYQFSVYKAKKLIGTIDVCADKTLGPSIYDIAFDPQPYKTTEAMKKSKEIAKKNYPTGQIKSTVMVVYSYPRVGAMTIVKDKTTGVEHRIFVDGYTLDEVQDKPVTKTEIGVWSTYDQILKSGKENNLKEWQKSDELAKSIEQAVANEGVNINTAVTEENMNKLSTDAATTASTSKKLGVSPRGQQNTYWCGPACIQMISLYYGYPTPTQKSIYYYFPFDPKKDPSSGLSPADIVKWVKNKWGKTGSPDTSFTNLEAVTEIDNGRPFFSMIPAHFRVCQGYLIQNGYFYLYINDPMPVGSSGTAKVERTYGSSESQRIYVR